MNVRTNPTDIPPTRSAISIRRWLFLALALLLALTLAACGGSKPEQAPPPPTRTPRPTFTPTPIPVQQPAPAQSGQAPAQPVQNPAGESPTPTPEPPTPTPEPKPIAVVNSPLINVRQGPGTTYPLAGQLERGTELTIVAKNPAGDWWQVCCVNGQNVWIADFLVDTSGPLETVPVAADIPPAPTPTPAPPTPTPAPAQPTPTPAPSFLFQKWNFIEPRINTNPVVTFFGGLCKGTCQGGDAIGGYKMVVEGPSGTFEGTFQEQWLFGDPGLDSQFIYNVKVEIPNGRQGAYKVYVADASGKPVSEPWEYTVTGDIRTFLPRWVQP